MRITWLINISCPVAAQCLWFDVDNISGAIRDGQDELRPPHSRLGKEEIIRVVAKHLLSFEFSEEGAFKSVLL